MGLRERLIQLDAVVVPRLARGAVRLARLRPGAGGSTGRRPTRAVQVLPVAALLVAAAIGVALVTQRAAAPSSQTTARVGVSDGDSIPDYLAAGRAQLSQLVDTAPDQAIYALVSFSDYLTPTQVATVVAAAGGLSTAAAYARVPLPHRQSELVRLGASRLPEDLLAAMDDVADRKVAEATAAAVRAAASPGPTGTVAAAEADLATAEANAYRAHCACVYALVVKADPRTLTRLAGQLEVRGIDPAPELRGITGAVFVAPLPEQADVVRPPDDDSLPGSGR